METLRAIAAVIIGIIIIIAIILLASFVGEKIRERFVKPKPQVTTQVTVPAPIESASSQTTPTATYSAIPSTGPNDWIYIITGAMFVGGLVAIKLSTKKFSSLPTA